MTRLLTAGRVNFNLLIAFLGMTVLTAMVGGLVLSALDKTVPDQIIALGAGALGALGTAFVRPPTGEPEPVVIEGQPVAVDVEGGSEEGAEIAAHDPKPRRTRKSRR